MPSHSAHLLKALELAKQGRGKCAPNPAVGALVVKENNIISEGYHHGPGLPHAEVEALGGLATAEGATVYVTLEPCCHWGKTPPCTRLLIEKRVAKVVYATSDPNPVVSGKGESELKAAGIEVEHVTVPEITAFYESYRHWTRTKKPRVTLKLAMSLDGKISPKAGERFQLTGEEAQRFTHEQRSLSDAILSTSQTVLVDDSQFNVRLSSTPMAKPVYLVGSNGDLPSTARIFQTASKLTWLEGNLQEVIEKIGGGGVHDLWVEAGPRFSSALLASGLVQRALFYVAPVWLGSEAVPALEGVEEILAKARSRRSWNLGADSCFEFEW